MVAERAELRLVRESLEAVVAPAIASAVIFEALAEIGGELAEHPGAAAELVHGPLREALRARVGDDADAMIDGVLQAVSAITGSGTGSGTTSSGSSSGGPRPGRDAEITREVVLDARPVIVFVVASGQGFASRLQAALGSSQVASVPVATLEDLTRQAAVAAPHIVLVDAADFAPIEPEHLAGALEGLAATTVRAIWGADLPYGAGVLRALVARSAPATPLDRREGIDPLLDLVRSRRID